MIAGTFHRGGAGDAHLGDRRDQWLEPDPGWLPRGASGRAAPSGLRGAMSNENAPATFDPLRPKLIRIAYRMLGSVADAEVDARNSACIRLVVGLAHACSRRCRSHRAAP